MEMEKHEFPRNNYLYASASQALAFVYDHRNIFADRTTRRQYYQGENVNVIEEYSRFDDGKIIHRHWWWWVFYPTYYEIYRWEIQPSPKEKKELLKQIIEKAKGVVKNEK